MLKSETWEQLPEEKAAKLATSDGKFILLRSQHAISLIATRRIRTPIRMLQKYKALKICKFLQKVNRIPDLHVLAKMESNIRRSILEEAKFALTQFRALCLTGPRQSGKTTLSKQLFKGKPYVNSENPGVQHSATSDPEGFLKQDPDGAIFDEVQRVPNIFRYLQEILDNNSKRGQFILTGSNNFLLQEQVSQ